MLVGEKEEGGVSGRFTAGIYREEEAEAGGLWGGRRASAQPSQRVVCVTKARLCAPLPLPLPLPLWLPRRRRQILSATLARPPWPWPWLWARPSAWVGGRRELVHTACACVRRWRAT